MKGKITFSYKERFKKAQYYEAPFLFDPLDINIRYAYPIGESIRINFMGDIVDINYDKNIWDTLERRFMPNKKLTGFTIPTTKPKRKHKPVVKF